jgi:hypothetical protein
VSDEKCNVINPIELPLEAINHHTRERQAAFVRQCDSRAVVRWLDGGGQPTFGTKASAAWMPVDASRGVNRLTLV